MNRLPPKQPASYTMNKKGISSRFSLLTGLMVLLLSVINPANANFEAILDQSIIASHDTFELTLRSDVDSSSAPDLSPLQKDFEILGTRQSRQVRIINGQSESWRDWVITLMPKQAGDLMIPSLALGSERSQPLMISIRDNLDDGSGSNASPVFMLAEVNSEDVYVQQEIVFTLQILYRVQLYDDSRLTPLAIDDAIVKQLGETRKFETVVENTRYRVFELVYSIHPQQVGELDIPSLTFNGTTVDNRDPFAGSFFSNTGKPIVARSPRIRVDVKPRPDDFKGNAWLPARNLSIRENWSHSPDKLEVGDAITRTITIEADGLSSVQLPPVTLVKPEGMNSYPDKSSTNDEETPNGVRGSRTDAIAMIPTRAGNIKLPAIRYSWFDTESQQTRAAEIPERTLNVAPSANAAALAQSVAPALTLNNESSNESVDCSMPEISEPVSKDHSHWHWYLITLTLLLLWLGTAGFWWYTRNNPVKKSRTRSISETPVAGASSLSENKAFMRFEAACSKSNPQQVRDSLKGWCLTLLSDKNLTTMAQCLEHLDSEPLKRLCQQLDSYLYSGGTELIDFKELLSVCSSLRKQQSPKDNPQDLNDIYPT